ncbi:MAG: TonB-dependent receptor [Mucilaginibacter sp.]|uniref:TonB-dependent receptor n=1 Tax=Mucilaginibacter sp. TaxID=1882438 RepID=UPI0031A73D67
MKFLLLKFFSVPKRNSDQLTILLRIMRYTTITFTVLLTCCNMLFAHVTNGQTIKNINVVIGVTNQSLKSAIKQIEKQTDFRFAYKNDELKAYNNVTIPAGNRTVEETLKLLLDQTGLMYKQRNNYILLVPKPVTPVQAEAKAEVMIPATDITIKGKVTDKATGEALIGVSIRVKGGTNGVATDLNGAFSINAPDNAILVVSYLGYVTAEVAVDKRTAINIALDASSKGLSEVVVVGYGTQKKVNLTGSIATVNSDKLENRPMVNLGDGLQGLIPNLNVSLGGGQPGTAATFNVRGGTTMSLTNGDAATTPLVLIDGVARDPNLIDPNDVASVTVLKDAASAAIYGGRAANGVILITTKSGKAGPTRVTYSGSYTISRPTRLVEQVNSLDYIKMFNEANRTGLKSGGYSTTPFTALDSTMATAYFNDPANNPTGYPDPANPKRYRYVGNTDWTKVLYPGWAPQQQHNISVSGGEGKTTFLTSMGYFRQEGLEKSANQVYQRYTPTLKVNSDVAKWLTLGLNMSMTHTDNNQPASTRINQGGAWLYSNIPPVMPVYNPDGNFAGQGNYTNPLAVNALSGRDIDAQNDFWTTGRIIIKPVDHVSVNVDYTWNALNDNRKANLIPFNEYGVNGTFLDIYPWTNPSQVIENKTNNNYNALNAFATYENRFGKHYVKALVGYNQEYQHYQLGSTLVKNLIDPNLPASGINNDPKPQVGSVETEYALVGTFSRLNYIYDDKYLVEINARYDGTSRFQPSSRYSFSPSASVGWNVAQESFMEGIRGTLNQLKLRASYGQLPNQLVPGVGSNTQMLNMLANSVASSAFQYPYIAVQQTGLVNYLLNGQQGIMVAAPGLVSSSFTWEKVQTKNFGLDYALFNSKLNGSFDYFITNIKDILAPGAQTPSTLGAPVPPTNSAAVTSHGWEFSLNYSDKINELNYSVTLGLSNTSNTRVTQYAGNPTQDISNPINYIFIKGQDLGNIYGYVNHGFYKTDAEAAAVDNSALAGYKWLAGDIKYKDLNGDGKINYGNNTLGNMGDKKLIGNTTPHYKFGFNLNLSYKSFDFATFIQGVLKQDFYPNEYVFYAFRDDEYSIPSQMTTNYWTPTNTNAYYPRIRFSGGGNEQAQDKYILNAAYARIKQLTFGYTLPSAIVKSIKLQKLRFYVTGANLFTFTSLNKSYDPETATNFGTYPLNKSLSFGVQATF